LGACLRQNRPKTNETAQNPIIASYRARKFRNIPSSVRTWFGTLFKQFTRMTLPGGDKIGTTKRGIGPAYASKATRNGLRMGDIKKPERFEAGLRALAADASARFEGFDYDVEAEIVKYREYAKRIIPFIADTVTLVNEQHAAGKRQGLTLVHLSARPKPFWSHLPVSPCLIDWGKIMHPTYTT